MRKSYLFPDWCRIPGWILSAIFAALCIMLLADTHLSGIYIYNLLGGYMDEVCSIGLIIGLLLLAFSREKDEDEYITHLRASSLVWAVIASYAILTIAIIALYDMVFLYAVFVNMYSVLVLYIIKFNLSLRKFRKSVKNEN